MKFMFIFLLVLFSVVACVKRSPPSPEETIRFIYSAYANNTAPNYFFENLNDKSVLSTRMKEAILKDQQATLDGELGTLEADPFCDCQDCDHLILEKVTVSQPDSNHASAIVQIRPIKDDPLGETNKIKIKLVKEKERWLVDDVITQNGGSVFQQLMDANP